MKYTSLCFFNIVSPDLLYFLAFIQRPFILSLAAESERVYLNCFFSGAVSALERLFRSEQREVFGFFFYSGCAWTQTETRLLLRFSSVHERALSRFSYGFVRGEGRGGSSLSLEEKRESESGQDTASNHTDG